MKTDIILCGVGGQGILSIATIIGEAAMKENLYIKQAEVCDYLRMTSNGALLTEELCNQLVESGLDYLKLSIEGIREEQYRSFCGVNIDFGKFVSTIAYLYRISRGKLKIGTKIISAAFENEEDRDLYMEIFAPITDYIYIRNVH